MLGKKRMTLGEFFAVLRQIKGWRVVKRYYLLDDIPEKIRKRSRSIKIRQYCPITAVAQKLSRQVFNETDASEKAAEVIGLSWRDADKIIEAADNKERTKLRCRLLQATGLGQ